MTTNDEMPETTDAPASPSLGAPRRPYKAPQLRSLGSVREVTWGGSPTSLEGAFRGVPMQKM